MWQVQWGMSGHWNHEMFTDRAVATEFWKKTVDGSDGRTKVILIEKDQDNKSRPVMTTNGAR